MPNNSINKKNYKYTDMSIREKKRKILIVVLTKNLIVMSIIK